MIEKVYTHRIVPEHMPEVPWWRVALPIALNVAVYLVLLVGIVCMVRFFVKRYRASRM